jgi:hypothetical protein
VLVGLRHSGLIKALVTIIVLGNMFTVADASNHAEANTGNANADKGSKRGCCSEDKALWYFERRVDGNVIDSGVLSALKVGISYLVYPSSNGGVIRLAVVMPPIPEGTPPLDLEPSWHLYNGVMLDTNGKLLGTMTAVQNTPGEEWLFQYEDRIIIDNEGYEQTNNYITVTASDKGNNRTWEMELSSGLWWTVSCTNEPADFIYGSSGCQWEELNQELRDLTLIEVELPKMKGHFFGLAYSEDTVWTVEIDGTDYNAKAINAHPGAVFPKSSIDLENRDGESVPPAL